MKLKYQNNIFILIILLFICLLNGCKKEDHSRFQASWSAKDPILTPYNIRKHEKDLGNLVLNSSFELGKFYYEENNIESFDINGWKKVGDGIEWINTENNKYKYNEAFEGTHAIKISRESADETDKDGSGIMSDYIKVIPGNYSLNLFLRLENICPNQARIGTKMFDAINIRLQYYDKNKIEIDGTEYNAFNNIRVDNRFKSYTLSNYQYIDELEWGEIHGRTANFPFYNGDIPDKTRYVKIFIGLKGSGKMWIDNIDYRYTSENFTLKERLEPYFDSSYSVHDLVFPIPRFIIKKNSIEYYNAEDGLSPIIVLPENADKELIEYADILKETFGLRIKNIIPDYNIDEIKIVKGLQLDEFSNKQFIISVGATNLYNQNIAPFADSVIQKTKQSYCITTIENMSNAVLINAHCSEGYNNALSTICQLFGNDYTVFHAANIVDYPDFLQRAYLIHEFAGGLTELSSKLKLFNEYKLNSPYFEICQNIEKQKEFQSIDNLVFTGLEKYSIMIDLLKEGNQSSTILKNIKQLHKSKYKPPESILISGQENYIYDNCISGKLDYDSIICLQENKQRKHIELLSKISKITNGSSNLEFIAPWSRLDIIDKSLGQAEFYYHDINDHISENISFYWTGGSFYSVAIDNAEFQRINTIMGKSPILFDNSLYPTEIRFEKESVRNYYAGKIRTLSLFEPYNLETFNEFCNQSYNNKILLNLNSLSELNTIRILTAANYFWNSSTYNPDQSLWIVLSKLYGRENAINLINYSDSYYGLKEICQKMKIDGLQHKNLRIANVFAKSLKENFSLLANNLGNEKIIEEINIINIELFNSYNKIIASGN